MTTLTSRPRDAQGTRPLFLEAPHAETLLGMILALAAELSTLTEEVAELREQLAQQRCEGAASQAEILERRAARRRGMISRLMRVVHQDIAGVDAEQRRKEYREFVESLSR